MWCLIRFHWGVCHYFISRAICWASVSRLKKNKQPNPHAGEVSSERTDNKCYIVGACEAPGGDEGDEMERDMWGSACCTCSVSSPWFIVFSYLIVTWKACVSLVNSPSLCSLRLAHRGRLSAATQQEALCVRFNHPAEKVLYLQNSVSPSVLRLLFCCRWVSWCTPLMLVPQRGENCGCCCCRHISFPSSFSPLDMSGICAIAW